ncbi:MAG TPA: flagellar hook-basal body complex protein FliE [Bryobacteraceae bacterium]|nr:flagellar hook-basal body complex protein FliE [Bryobacteraceae bacterium]
MSGIRPIDAIALPQAVAAPAATAKSDGAFRSLLENAIGGVESARQTADGQVQAFLNGDGGELHTAALATQKAEMTFELFVQVRNKVVQAYQEVMRMQI